MNSALLSFLLAFVVSVGVQESVSIDPILSLPHPTPIIDPFPPTDDGETAADSSNIMTEAPTAMTEDWATDDSTDSGDETSSPTSSLSPSAHNCADLRSDCDPSQCFTDKQKIMCGATCGTCDMRYQCINAYGDAECDAADFLCDALPIVKIACKKSCERCVAPCVDYYPTCTSAMCSRPLLSPFCAKTCGKCSSECSNAYGDALCGDLQTIGFCNVPGFGSGGCAKTCGAC